MVYLGKNRKKAKPRHIVKGERRENVINRVMDVLGDWRSSPFENEGILRAGLRSALCLEGHGWGRSDIEAEGILAECFRRMGAKRPTWLEGQPEYTGSRTVCLRCGGWIAEEDQFCGRRFCSDVCAQGLMVDRRHWPDKQSYLAYNLAWGEHRERTAPPRNARAVAARSQAACMIGNIARKHVSTRA